VGAAYAYSSGAVVFDPSLPISNVTAHVHGVVPGLGHTFAILGRQALISATLPYVYAEVGGQVFEEQRNVTRSGLGDLKTRVSLNLYGNPALTREEFARRERPPFLIGTSLTVSYPTGQYYGDKLINIGTNRWAFKPEVGLSVPWKRLYLDVYGGAWFFTENANYYPGGASRQQDPLTPFRDTCPTRFVHRCGWRQTAPGTAAALRRSAADRRAGGSITPASD
jgi:hypothetical protein